MQSHFTGHEAQITTVWSEVTDLGSVTLSKLYLVHVKLFLLILFFQSLETGKGRQWTWHPFKNNSYTAIEAASSIQEMAKRGNFQSAKIRVFAAMVRIKNMMKIFDNYWGICY